MEVRFEQGEETGREQRRIPAELYNKIRVMFGRHDGAALFVPIRSMQYLAVIDAEETVFVDGNNRRNIAISWQRFRPGVRTDFSQPVAFECVYYVCDGPEIMKRLQGAFLEALTLLESRQAAHGKNDHEVIPFSSK